MTRLFSQAIAIAQDLPPEVQDELARLLFAVAGHQDVPLELSKAEKQSLAISLAQANRGDFASEAEIRSVWAKHGV
jgi:hypothetical protein